MDEVAYNPCLQFDGFEEDADWGNDNQAGMKYWCKLDVVRNLRFTVEPPQ